MNFTQKVLSLAFFGAVISLFTPEAMAQAPAITNLRTLCAFSGSNGAYPDGGVLRGGDGNYYGLTPYGGSNNNGAVFQASPAGLAQPLCLFSGSNGSNPVDGLLAAGDGGFYGTTMHGGSGSAGTVFYVSASGSLSTLCSFSGANGSTPCAKLLKGGDGNLYGTTELGGSSGYGTVFMVTASGSLSTLCSFTGANGAYPMAGLASASDGNFYGTTYSGSGNNGTVFRITASGSLTTLCSFTGTNGSFPYGALLQGTDGNFYGTTSAGGSGGHGTVFRVTPAGILTTLCAFTGTSGACPGDSCYSGLTQSSNGDMYGVTYNGGTNNLGALFKVTPNGVATPLYSFSGTDGRHPNCELLQDGDNNFMGTTNSGGNGSMGTLFQFVPSVLTTGTANSLSYQIYASNSPTGYGADGLPPGLTLDPATGLITGTPTATGTFGVTTSAINASGTGTGLVTFVVVGTPEITGTLTASANQGTIFNYQITANNSPASYAVSGLPAGLSSNPISGLISGVPTVTGTFSVSLSASNLGGTGNALLTLTILPPKPVVVGLPCVLSTLFSFNGTNGQTPYAGLTQGADGYLYGTTEWGGSSSYGTAFRITPAGVFTSLCSFSSGPCGQLLQWSDGNFYGTCEGGNWGNLFRMTPNGDVTSLYSFTYSWSSGVEPYAGLILGKDGNFYGTTTHGNNGGSVFRVTSAGSLTTLCNPGDCYGGLVQASDGAFYGTTYSGGTNNKGTVYRATSDGGLLRLCSFTGSNGAFLYGGLIQANDGNLYGTTFQGGSADQGTVFKMTTDGTLTTLYSFAGTDGSWPYSTLLQGNDGNLYGTTETGGPNNKGTVFQITADGTLTSLCAFNGLNGAFPTAGLIQATDGNYYGTTGGGGVYNNGTVFKLSPGVASTGTTAGYNYQIVATSQPTSFAISGLPPGLTLDSSTGLISGTPTGTGTFATTIQVTGPGGTTSASLTIVALPIPSITSSLDATCVNATAFSYQIQGSDDPSSYGASGLPAGLSVNTATGLISGTPALAASGTYNVPITVTTPGGTGVATLNLVAILPPPDISGQLSATGTYGAGFRYSISASNGPSSFNASGLPSGLGINTTTGLISGTPTATGIFSVPIYAINSSGTGSATLTLLLNNPPAPTITGLPSVFTSLGFFTGTTGPALGSQPYASLIQGNDGNFYGTTYAGGTSNFGTVFQITPAGTFRTLLSFNGANGKSPQGALVQGTDGKFYGTTAGGGASNNGTVFKIDSNGTLTTLCSFNGTNGSNPVAGLVLGSDGYFYGTTQNGGGASQGTVFKVSSAGLLSSFTVAGYPYSKLAQGNDGNFYGTTYSGGSYGYGSVFKMTPGGVITTLCSFAQTNGAYPYANLILGADGYFYGTTYGGGSAGYGTVFRVDSTGALTSLYSFGSYAFGGLSAPLAQGGTHDFYGTTNPSGAVGTIFKITTSGSVSTLFTFSPLNGLNPYAGLSKGSDGNYYGTTQRGGSSGYGTVYRFCPATALAGLQTGFKYQISATNNPTSYSATGLPSGLSVDSNTGLISGTPTVTGTFSVTLSASNITGTGVDTMKIVVQSTSIITSPLTTTAALRSSFSYQIVASSGSNSFSATGLPAWMSINPNTGLISGVPTSTGTFQFTISAISNGVTQSATLSLAVNTSYAIWQNQVFTSAQLADPATSGAFATPAKDGTPNLMKYALNLSPLAPATSSGLPSVGSTVDASSNRYLTLQHTRLISAPDVVYVVEVSGDLQTWNSGSGYTAVVSDTDNLDGLTHTVVVRDLIPMSSSTQRFIRLKVSGSANQ